MDTNVFGDPITDDTHITHGQIYNYTEYPVSYHTTHDYYGESKEPYPSKIESGKSDTFVHVSDNNTPARSSAAVVYRGKNHDGEEADFMLAWYNKWVGNSPSTPSPSECKVYTEICKTGHFDDPSVWENINVNMQKQGIDYRYEWHKLSSTVKTDTGTPPQYEAKLELTNGDAAA